MLQFGFYKWTLILLMLSFNFTNILAQNSQSTGKIYYVSGVGNDNNSGTSPDLAWKTLEKLQAEIDSRRIINGSTISFRAGDIFIGNLNLKNFINITITKYDSGDNPILTGLSDISGSWENYYGNIYRKEISASDVKYLTIGGRHYLKGKYPNKGYYFITTGDGENFFIDDINLTQGNDYWNGAELVLRLNAYWFQLKTVSDYEQSTHKIEFTPNLYAGFKTIAGYGYFFQNSINCLLDDGDWYFSGDSIYLYYSTNPNGLIINASIYDDGIIIASGGKITISELGITGYNRYGIYSSTTYNNNISNNNLSYCLYGLYLNQSDTFKIENNKIHNNSLYGIYVNNSKIGEIEKNKITSIGMNVGYGNQGLQGMFLSNCDSIVVYKNDLDSIGYNGILYTMGDRLHAERNRVRNFCQVADDGGGLYVYYCNKIYVPNLHHNYWKDNFVEGGDDAGVLESQIRDHALIMGLYIDGGSGYMRVENNLSVRNTINFMNLSTNNSYIRNNWTAKARVSGLWQPTEIMFSDIGIDIENNTFYNNKFITNYVDGGLKPVCPLFSWQAQNILKSTNVLDSNYFLLPTLNREIPANYDTPYFYFDGPDIGIEAWKNLNFTGENEKTDVIKWNANYSHTSRDDFVTYDYNFSDLIRYYNFQEGWTYYNIDGIKISSMVLAPYEGAVLYRINNRDHPVVSNIPNQILNNEGNFNSIILDNFFNDPNYTNNQIIWTYSGNNQLSVNINPATRIATITPINSEWNGTETIIFRATNPEGIYDSDEVSFTIYGSNTPPVVSNIPNQTILKGNPFTSIDLDNYVDDSDNTDNEINWSFSECKQLSIEIEQTTRIATIVSNSPDWIGSETITFMATDPVGLFDINQVTFTVLPINNPPEIENQEFIINLWEFDNDYIGKIQVSDPDPGQMITYTIINGNESGIFKLDPVNGDLRTSNSYNLSQTSSEHNIMVIIEDNGDIVKSDTAIIKVVFLEKQLTFYIDPTNINDPLSNGTLEHPFSSWNKVIWEDSCTYLQKKGTTSTESKINIYASNIILGSYGEGELPFIQSNAKDFAIRAFEKNNIYIKDLHIVAPEAISCIYILGSTEENRIENCIFEGTENAIRVIDSKSVIICYNTFIDCSSAIYSFAEKNNIYYNVFRNNQIAINITSYLASTEIYNNVFYGNHTGVSVSYSDLILYNNIFYLENTGDMAINVKMDQLISDNNIFYPEQEDFISVSDRKFSTLAEFQNDLGLDLKSFNIDPQFRDVYNNNFAVSDNSPAIDAGKTIGLEMDFFGTTVPSGKSTDIGLVEAISNLSTPVTSIELSESDDNQHSLMVFPNPSDGRFQINLEGISKKATKACIIDIAGKTIYEKLYYPGESELFLYVDISHIPKGIYLVMLNDGNKSYYQRIIIN